ncbi:MAG: acyl carrier protein [Clostridia bacterium]|nr:acyl carrier protein [Clostridia bacterium]
METDQIKGEDNFKLDLGMSSFDTVCLVTEINSVLGVEVKATDFIRYKTVGEMCEYISTLKK